MDNKQAQSAIDKKKQIQLPMENLQQLRSKYFQMIKENRPASSPSSPVNQDAGEATEYPQSSPLQPPIFAKESKAFAPLQPPEGKRSTADLSPGNIEECKQTLAIILNLLQNTLEKILVEFHDIAPDLDLSHSFNKALQILRREVLVVENQGDAAYQRILDLFQDRIYVVVLFNSTPGSWSDITEKLQEQNELLQPPCKIFYFLFRLIAIFLRCIKDKVEKEKKAKMAVSILQILEIGGLYLQPSQNLCSLKEIFQHCRKNPLQANVKCMSYKGAKIEAYPSEVDAMLAKTSKEMQEEEVSQEIEVSSQEEAFPAEDTTSDTIFSGDLSYISIWQILQMLGNEKKDGCLSLLVQGEKIQIYIKDGMVLQCESAEYEGEQLFYHALSQERGRFTFDRGVSPSNITINQPIQYLLMEGARIIDEQERNEEKSSH